MNTAMIISGGNIDSDFALRFLEEHPYRYLIAADRGLLFLKNAGILPTHIVGDFDSAGADAAAEYIREHPEIPVLRLQPRKDDTDTHAAISLALELGAECIYLLGCTGTRLDHVIASIRDMRYALKQNVECYMVDPHNRIRLSDKSLSILRDEQYGKYVSLFALGGEVRGLTLKGFAYPLQDYVMDSMTALGVSNEITDAVGSITFSEGILLIAETAD